MLGLYTAPFLPTLVHFSLFISLVFTSFYLFYFWLGECLGRWKCLLWVTIFWCKGFFKRKVLQHFWKMTRLSTHLISSRSSFYSWISWTKNVFPPVLMHVILGFMSCSKEAQLSQHLIGWNKVFHLVESWSINYKCHCQSSKPNLV